MRLSLLLVVALTASASFAQTPRQAPRAQPPVAQPPTGGLPFEVVNQGASYIVFTEPGAPTVDVFVVQSVGRSGVFRVAEGTTLTEVLVLAGGTGVRSEQTRQFVRTASVRVLRGDGGGGRTVVYEATPEQMLREPGRHPQLQTGDVIETDATVEEVRPRVTALQVLEVAARVASLVSLVFILTNQF